MNPSRRAAIDREQLPKLAVAGAMLLVALIVGSWYYLGGRSGPGVSDAAQKKAEEAERIIRANAPPPPDPSPTPAGRPGTPRVGK